MTDVRTEDGVCPVHTFTPPGTGPWPGILVFMDALGVRPAMFEIAERLAGAGYVVAMPDLYYRTGYTPPTPTAFFADAEVRAHWREHILPTLNAANIMRDMPALLAHLGAHPDVTHQPMGVVGYCLGGRLALTAAGHFAERIAAAASYHGGGLATDAPESPHRLASRMKARVYVGGAIEDSTFDDAQKARLEAALTDAGVDHVIETYPARHGWVLSDTPVHDAAATARHWETLLALFAETLTVSRWRLGPPP